MESFLLSLMLKFLPNVVLSLQAIQQFGTDFEMILQLFPGRTRHELKAKYKNEERKHPLEVRDALIYRSKGENLNILDVIVFPLCLPTFVFGYICIVKYAQACMCFWSLW